LTENVFAVGLAFLAVFAKPVVSMSDVGDSVLNSVVIICVAFSLSVLWDLTQVVFRIPTKGQIEKIAAANKSAGG
jgi:hypothetical protein